MTRRPRSSSKSRREIRKSLQVLAQEPTERPDASFVQNLERRLVHGDIPAPRSTSPGRAYRRGRTGMALAAVAAGAVTFGVLLTSGSGPQTVTIASPPQPSVPTSAADGSPTDGSQPPGSTSQPPAQSVATTPTLPETPGPSDRTTAPGTTVPTTTSPSAPTPAATPAAPTPTATTPPPGSGSPAIPGTPTGGSANSPSTEVPRTMTMTMACAHSGPTTVVCNWSAEPTVGTVYRILRTSPADTRGRVFTPSPGQLTYTDTLLAPGQTVSYKVQAVVADGTPNGNLINQSPYVNVP